MHVFSSILHLIDNTIKLIVMGTDVFLLTKAAGLINSKSLFAGYEMQSLYHE